MTKKATYYFISYWFPILLYCFIIFFQSSLPMMSGLPKIPYGDKIFHFLGYALLGGLLLRGFSHSRFRDNYKSIVICSIFLTGIYGAGDELHQQYVPYRSSDAVDLLFDLLGGIFGVFIYGIIMKRRPRISRV